MIHRPVFSGLSKKEILRKWLETRTQLKIREKAAKKKMFKTSENPENSCSGPLKKKTREKTIPLSLNVKK